MASQSERIPIATGERAPLPLHRILLPSGEDPHELRFSALYKALEKISGLNINPTLGSHQLIAAWEAAVKAKAKELARGDHPGFPGQVMSADLIARAVKELGDKSCIS